MFNGVYIATLAEAVNQNNNSLNNDLTNHKGSYLIEMKPFFKFKFFNNFTPQLQYNDSDRHKKEEMKQIQDFTNN